MTPAAPAERPELGSLLGGLLEVPGEKSPIEAELERIRLELLTALFEGAAAEGSALRAPLWLEAWEQAVAAVTRALAQEIERRLRAAAAESRFPARRLAAALPDSEARRVLAARLGAAGMPLEQAAALLDDPGRGQPEALRRVAGELEAAWQRLRAVARAELEAGDARAAELRAWRRPWGPLLLAAAILIPVGTWLGLVLGGYLRAPRWLRPLTDWVWNL